jgi:hypothetical protein
LIGRDLDHEVCVRSVFPDRVDRISLHYFPDHEEFTRAIFPGEKEVRTCGYTGGSAIECDQALLVDLGLEDAMTP